MGDEDQLGKLVKKYMDEKAKVKRCIAKGIRFKDKSHIYLKQIAALQGSKIKVPEL